MGSSVSCKEANSCCSSKATEQEAKLDTWSTEPIPVSDNNFISPHSESARAGAEGIANKAEPTLYVVTFDKTGGKKLGVDVDHLAEAGCLPVRKVHGGLAEQWNLEHPDKKIVEGDTIIEVNGAKDSVPALLEKCKNENVL